MRRIGAALSVAMSLQASAALACKCSLTPRDVAIKNTEIVFVGRVLRLHEDADARYADIEFMQAIKGATLKVMEVATPRSSAACGYDFRQGETLTVGVTLREAQYWAKSCAMHSLNPKRAP